MTQAVGSEPAQHNYLPLTLSVETVGGLATPIVRRGTPLPAKRIEAFSTAEDNQEEVTVSLYLGESPLARRNMALGRFSVGGLPKAPRGVPAIKISIEVNKFLNVTVAALGDNKVPPVNFAKEGKDLSLSRIEEVLSQTKTPTKQDLAEVELIEVKNTARSEARRAESYIRDKQEKGLKDSACSQLEIALADIGPLLDGSDSDSIRNKSKEIEGILRAGTDKLFSDFGNIFNLNWSEGFHAPSKIKKEEKPVSKPVPSKSKEGGVKPKAVATSKETKPPSEVNVVESKRAILAVFASPRCSDPLRLGEEDRALRECLALSRYRDNTKLTVLHAATIHDVRRALLNEHYRIVHLSGHGTGKGFALEDAAGDIHVVSESALGELLAAYSPPLECAILNACFTKGQGKKLASFLPFAIGMSGAISDKGAIEFTRGFYDAIGAGKDIPFAFGEGQRTVKLMGASLRAKPVLFNNGQRT